MNSGDSVDNRQTVGDSRVKLPEKWVKRPRMSMWYRNLGDLPCHPQKLLGPRGYCCRDILCHSITSDFAPIFVAVLLHSVTS